RPPSRTGRCRRRSRGFPWSGCSSRTGAIPCNTPIRVAVALGARRLFVLPTGYACALEAPPCGAIACALHALTLLIARQLLHELHGLESGIEYFVVPPLCPLLGSPHDFSQTDKLIKRAAESVRSWPAEGGLTRRCEIPRQMHAHNHRQLLELSDGLCIRPGSVAALIASGHRNDRQSAFQSGAAILEK